MTYRKKNISRSSINIVQKIYHSDETNHKKTTKTSKQATSFEEIIFGYFIIDENLRFIRNSGFLICQIIFFWIVDMVTVTLVVL